MARESCNLDKDEAEILKPSSSSPSHPSSSSPPFSSSPPPSLLPSSSSQSPRELRSPSLKRPLETTSSENSRQPPPAARFGNRCSSCRKKVGLTGFKCRCGDLFCGQHRYSDAHNCSFDYKAAGREEISKANPVIRAAKIIKI